MVDITRRKFLTTVSIGAGVAATGFIPSTFTGLARAAGEDDETYKVGLITALSGSGASLGQPMLVGAKIAVEQINANGGVNGKPLELLVRDSRAKPADATVAARELVGEGCNLLFGAVSSSVALAITGILPQLNATLITCAAHSMKLTKENFNKHYFRITDNPYMRERAIAKLMAEEYPNVTNWGGLIPDHEYGRTTWDALKHGLNEFYPKLAGVDPSVARPILTQYGASDFRNYIASAMTGPSEGFFVSVYAGEAVTLFQQAKAYGFFNKAKVIADSANEFIVAKAMREEMPEMWVGSHWYYGAFEGNEISDRLYERAVEVTGDKTPMGFVSEAHSAVLAYAAALEKSGTNETQSVIKALEDLTFETATGPRTIRAEDHQTIKPVILYKLRGANNENGFEVLETRVIKGEDVIDPPTPGKAIIL
tara:strand:+ start:2273 stop:3547 length:1275 start_codon:yes stop_codon:yes gene_type:complete